MDADVETPARTSTFTQVRRALIDLMSPPRCAGCGVYSREDFCAGCIARFEAIEGPYCPQCGMPHPASASGWPLCSECRESKRSALDGARAFAMHTGPLRQAILHYKYSNRRDLAPTLAAELARRMDNEYARPKRLPLDEVGAIVPVVLHPLRREWRGFDQAQALARSLSELSGKPLWDDTLARVKDTTPQVSLSPGQRAENMRGAFEARKGWKLAGATLLLVDDVYTTGATLRAAARALKDAGAARVFGLTITRAAPKWHPDSFASLTEP